MLDGQTASGRRRRKGVEWRGGGGVEGGRKPLALDITNTASVACVANGVKTFKWYREYGAWGSMTLIAFVMCGVGGLFPRVPGFLGRMFNHLLPACEGFGENVQPFTPRVRGFWGRTFSNLLPACEGFGGERSTVYSPRARVFGENVQPFTPRMRFFPALSISFRWR